MPLVYAIPLQVVGVILHVLASNFIYVYISESKQCRRDLKSFGQYVAKISDNIAHSWDHTPPPSEIVSRLIGVETSKKAELTSICIFTIALVITLVLRRIFIPGLMVVAGNSSAAISAASHVT